MDRDEGGDALEFELVGYWRLWGVELGLAVLVSGSLSPDGGGGDGAKDRETAKWGRRGGGGGWEICLPGCSMMLAGNNNNILPLTRR